MASSTAPSSSAARREDVAGGDAAGPRGALEQQRAVPIEPGEAAGQRIAVEPDGHRLADRGGAREPGLTHRRKTFVEPAAEPDVEPRGKTFEHRGGVGLERPGG